MEYKEFILEKYRAVNQPITIKVDENKLFCIIGENECGKSTILQGIYAFDYSNDAMTQGVHLKDVGNLYNIGDNNIAKIKAIISIKNSKPQINETLKRFNPNAEEIDLDLLTITRTINGKTFYSIQELQNETEEVQNSVAKEIINHLPKIIYFDDFTDPLPNKINLKDEQFRTWINVVDLLIQSIDADSNLTIQSLLDGNSSDNLVKSICASMSRKLNTTIVEQWKEIRLEKDGVNFKIEVEFDRSKNTLEFKLIEKVNDQDDRYFDIRQRSKGFYWFFNFVMRTEFNPKGSFGNEKGAIFLFDEPGAYLHVSMQNSLCKKLKLLSEKNVVVYCTHSPELIDYETIDKTWVCYRDMSNKGNILLKMAEDFYQLKKLDKNRKQIIIEPLINKSIIHDLYNLKEDKDDKFKGTKEILRKAGSALYYEIKDIATTTAAKTIKELSQ
jgi:predicted ATP-dependent endonuclease of OLD family